MSDELGRRLAALRKDFIERLPDRVAALDSQFSAVGRGEADAVAELQRIAHALVGAAGVHRLMELSDAARQLEQMAASLLTEPATPPATAHERLSEAMAVLHQAAQSPVVSVSRPAPKTGTSTQKILVVDDDPDQALWLRSVLEPAGYQVEVLTELDAFREICQTGDLPSAVIMDMVFPQGRDAGAAAIAELKDRSPYGVPVIFVSVRQDMASRLAAYRAGATRYIVKPLKAEHLLQVLGDAMPLLTEEPYRVLMVDDDETQLQAHAAILRAEGMDVHTCSNPMEVLHILRDFQAEALVLDLYMPQCAGIELASIVRDEDYAQDVPIVYLSAEKNVSLQYLVLDRGGEHFLSKPVDPRQLVLAVGLQARRCREYRRQRQRLKHANERQQWQQRALDAHAIVSMADAAGNITYANQKFCETSGYAQDELIGNNHRVLKSGAHPDSFYAQLWQTVRSGSIWQGEICNRRKDGSLYWVISTIVPLLDEQGRPFQYISVRTEITNNKQIEAAMAQARQEAEAANRSKSQFLARISHELRTPLNAILGYSQLMGHSADLPDSARSNAQEIEQAGQHLLRLVNDLVDLARIESGSMVLSIEPVPLEIVVEESIRMVGHLAQRLGITVEVAEPAGPAALALADYGRLRQILINLLSNAIKYNHPQGHVGVHVRADTSARWRIEVHDTGPGIALDKQDRVFRDFDRLGEEHGGVEGAGIGLSISRRLVQAMGGEIGFESSPGTGSNFWLQLRASARGQTAQPYPEQAGDTAVAEPKAAVAESGQSHARGPRKVLYIEDNSMNRRLMRQIFGRRPDLELMDASEAELGLSLAHEHGPAVILMDINLPGMSGYQALEALRADPVTAAIPVVAISANAMKGDEERGMKAGFAAYLTKPLQISTLLSTLDSILVPRSNAS